MPAQVSVGQQTIAKKVFTNSDLEKYSQLIKRKTLIVSNNDFVPEALLAGLFSTILGTTLPGEGTIYLKQSLNFLNKAKVGDEISVKVEISSIRADKGLITCKTTCLASNNEIICEGEALVMNKTKVS